MCGKSQGVCKPSDCTVYNDLCQILIDSFLTAPNCSLDDNCIIFPPFRPCDPRTAVLLHPAVPEQSRGARESLWGASAGPGHGSDSPTPKPASLGFLSGLREAAAAGARSSYTALLSICARADENLMFSFLNEM